MLWEVWTGFSWFRQALIVVCSELLLSRESWKFIDVLSDY
jgi:hypothetical protein